MKNKGIVNLQKFVL